MPGWRPHDRWRKQVEVNDVVLVCDVGGGTSDFSLIVVSEEAGQVALTRVAVGDHIAGGDTWTWPSPMRRRRNWVAELRRGADADVDLQLLDGQGKAVRGRAGGQRSGDVLGRGRSVLGGALKGEVTRAELEKILLEGFFPQVGLDANPYASARLACRNWDCPTPRTRRRRGTSPISCTAMRTCWSGPLPRKRRRRK